MGELCGVKIPCLPVGLSLCLVAPVTAESSSELLLQVMPACLFPVMMVVDSTTI